MNDVSEICTEFNGEPRLQKKRGRLTTLGVINEAENGEPQLQSK